MAKQTGVFSPRVMRNTAVTFVNSDGTTIKEIFAAGADDSLLRSIGITNDDSSGIIVKIYFYDGTTDFLITALTVPAGAGADGTTAAVNGLDFSWLTIDANAKKFLALKTGCKIRVKMNSVVPSTKTVTIFAIGEDY